MQRMSEQQMLYQLKDLVADRESFLAENSKCSIDIFKDDIIALEQIIHDYKLLRDVVYKDIEKNGENLNIWINEKVKLKRIDVLNFWETDYNDLRCNAILYKNEKELANIIVKLNLEEVEDYSNRKNSVKEYNNKIINTAFKSFIYEHFDEYVTLPKVTDCSSLLKEIYDIVCNSESGMCYITSDDWNKDYFDIYSTKDLDILGEEIKKYKLEDVIELNCDDYKIIGYSDLEIKFNDDRDVSKIIEYER